MKVTVLLRALAILAAATAHWVSAIPGDQNWDPRFGLAPGFNGTVRAFAVMGTNLFVAGDFTRIGDQQISRVARWDGTQWYALGSGIEGLFTAMATRGETLFIVEHDRNMPPPPGGDPIGPTNAIRYWDGASWWNIGSNVMFRGESDAVEQIVCTGSNLFVGGHFVATNPASATNLLRWDGSSHSH